MSKEIKQRPPVGDFTKDCAKKYIYHWNECCWDEPCGKAFREACDRLDTSEQQRKDLREALKELAATFVGLPEGSIGGQAMKKANVVIAKAKQ